VGAQNIEDANRQDTPEHMIIVGGVRHAVACADSNGGTEGTR
jgi:hypothetical protein